MRSGSAVFIPARDATDKGTNVFTKYNSTNNVATSENLPFDVSINFFGDGAHLELRSGPAVFIPTRDAPDNGTNFIINYTVADDVDFVGSSTNKASDNVPFYVPIIILGDGAHFKFRNGSVVFIPSRDAPAKGTYLFHHKVQHCR